MQLKRTLFLLLVAALSWTDMQAQSIEFPSLDKSPMDAAHYPRRAAFANYLDADDADRNQKIKVLYSRPQKNGRVIFGDLVPYNAEWRLGANEATEVTFYQPVEIGGVRVSPGTYTMFADVYPGFWNIKLSKERFIAGNNNRKKDMDILAAPARVTTVPSTQEAFTLGFKKIDDYNVHMVFQWDNTRAALPINFTPVELAPDDASPMDMAVFPANSRLRNFVKPEEFDASAQKIRVVYSRPQKKGRDVFGGMKKTGDMWRAGANETTQVTFFDDVMIGGKTVKAGTYGLFIKLNEGSWDFILHSNAQSWGFQNHDEKNNVATVSAKTEKTPSTVEAMAIVLQDAGDNKVNMVVAWDDMMAKMPITLK